MPAVGTSFVGQMPSLNSLPLPVKRAPATFLLIVVTSVCFLLFYPAQWVGMLELFNFVPFRSAGGYVAFGDMNDEWWRLVTPTFIHFGWLHVVFNCLWLWEFGQRIEHRLGAINVLGLYGVTAMVSNYCQYLWEGPFNFRWNVWRGLCVSGLHYDAELATTRLDCAAAHGGFWLYADLAARWHGRQHGLYWRRCDS
jgi:hypothetical protein